MSQNTDFYAQLPTLQQIENIFASCKRQDETAAVAAGARMQNYFNCVDDYSWGGICDRVADESRGQRLNLCSHLKDQVANGCKAFVETFNIPVLCDMNGNVLTDRIVNGRFGLCWIIGNQNATFVSVAKKMATYAKKGYQVKTRKTTVEFYYTGRITKSGRSAVCARILSTEVVNDVPEIDEIGRQVYVVTIATMNS